MASILVPCGRPPRLARLFSHPNPTQPHPTDPSQFWKQFFEASANVSLSGYEEATGSEDNTALTAEESTIHESTADYTPRPRSAGEQHDSTLPADQSSAMYTGGGPDESALGGDDDDGDLTGSTPRPPATKTMPLRPQFAAIPSPYEALKREYDSHHKTRAPAGGAAPEEEDTELLFQQHTARLPDLSTTPRGAPAASHPLSDDEETPFSKPKKDPLLHHTLQKTYRIASTPHKTTSGSCGLSPIKWAVNPAPVTLTPKDKPARPLWQDSPTSSPEMAVPQLRSAAFMSPVRAAYLTKGKGKAPTTASASGLPRTPGVSVQTPARGTARHREGGGAQGTGGGGTGRQAGRYEDEITWEESDSEGGLGGMSPPKTIQFAVPASKLLQTPGMYSLFLPPPSLFFFGAGGEGAFLAARLLLSCLTVGAGEPSDG